jgi:hypothetical protein
MSFKFSAVGARLEQHHLFLGHVNVDQDGKFVDLAHGNPASELDVAHDDLGMDALLEEGLHLLQDLGGKQHHQGGAVSNFCILPHADVHQCLGGGMFNLKQPHDCCAVIAYPDVLNVGNKLVHPVGKWVIQTASVMAWQAALMLLISWACLGGVHPLACPDGLDNLKGMIRIKKILGGTSNTFKKTLLYAGFEQRRLAGEYHSLIHMSSAGQLLSSAISPLATSQPSHGRDGPDKHKQHIQGRAWDVR